MLTAKRPKADPPREPVSAVRSRADRSNRRRIVVLVLAIVAFWFVWQLASARNQLTSARRSLTSATEAVKGRDDALALRQLHVAASQIAAARHVVNRFPLGIVQPVPVVGSPFRAVRDATRAADHAVAAGQIVARAASSFPTGGQAGIDGHDLAPFHSAAVTSQAAVDRADHELKLANDALAGPAGSWLPPVSHPARQLRTEVAAKRTQLAGGRRGLSVLAGLTAPGANTPL
jgi:hypothetical protein